jgi:23S rRNA pseudouridine1911/1915/1917 synthase
MSQSYNSFDNLPDNDNQPDQDAPDTPPSETSEPVSMIVGDAIKYRRLDQYLHGRFSNLSRRYIQEAIKQGAATVNGKPAKPSLKLNPGDQVSFVLPEPPNKNFLPEDLPLNIIFEDNDLIILNKQPGIIVHPARGNTHGTLVNALMFYSDNLSTGLGDFRPGIVHRLDRETSGVMIVTKNDHAQWKIAKQFEQRHIDKTYLAIVHGTPQLSADRIKAPLGVHPVIREKYAIRPISGKEAVTFYEVLEAFRGFSFLKLTPKTGRTHQIRVHLSHLKHPIVADDMYGGKLVYPWQLADAEPAVEEPIIDRVALHALSIQFKHPTTEQIVRFEAPLPQDMQHMLEMLRKYRII